jgi:hypothetical protein
MRQTAQVFDPVDQARLGWYLRSLAAFSAKCFAAILSAFSRIWVSHGPNRLGDFWIAAAPQKPHDGAAAIVRRINPVLAGRIAARHRPAYGAVKFAVLGSLDAHLLASGAGAGGVGSDIVFVGGGDFFDPRTGAGPITQTVFGIPSASAASGVIIIARSSSTVVPRLAASSGVIIDRDCSTVIPSRAASSASVTS